VPADSAGDLRSPMLPSPSPRSAALAKRISAFLKEHILPAEAVFQRQVDVGDRWGEPPVITELKAKAKK